MKLPNYLPKTHLFTEEDLRLYEFPQIFSISSLWHKSKMNNQLATYDLIVRDLPKNRNFMVLTGIEEAIKEIIEWKYTNKEVLYLLKMKFISKEFADYLKKFIFTGDVWAMPEGTIFFPGEPVIRITAPIIEGNLFTMLLMNILTSNTTFSTKAVRSVIAAKNKTVIGFTGMRAHANEASMKSSRAAYILGTTINTISFWNKYKLKQKKSTMVVAYHAFIKSMPTEIEAMRLAASNFSSTSLMIDTYDIISGTQNAIIIAKELEKQGKRLFGIIIDSGDLYKNTCLARKMLDKNNLQYVQISVASNLDEYKIESLINKKIPADSFVVCTEGLTVSDDPKLEVVYKICEIQDGKKIKPLAKLAENKISYPGKKNVYRIYKNNIMQKDIIGLEGEKIGKPLLIKMISKGKLIYRLPRLNEIKKYTTTQIKQLPKKLLSITKVNKYQVDISNKLNELLNIVIEEHKQ